MSSLEVQSSPIRPAKKRRGAAKKRAVRSRAFVFTVNQVFAENVEDFSFIINDARFDVRYVIGQGERAPSTGHPHIQGYIEFNDPKTVTGVVSLHMKCLDGAHIEIARGTQDQNENYVWKDESYAEDVCARFKYGKPVYRGCRSISMQIHEAALAGSSFVSILTSRDLGSYAMRMVSGLRELCNAVKASQKRVGVIEVRLYIGSPGSGKTHTAREWLLEGCPEVDGQPDMWVMPGASSVRDMRGYECQSRVLFDDFSTGRLPISLLKNLLDPLFTGGVQVIGGVRAWLCSRIAITTNQYPKVWSGERDYTETEQLALFRRFGSIFRFSGAYADGSHHVERLESYGDRVESKSSLNSLPAWWHSGDVHFNKSYFD